MLSCEEVNASLGQDIQIHSLVRSSCIPLRNSSFGIRRYMEASKGVDCDDRENGRISSNTIIVLWMRIYSLDCMGGTRLWEHVNQQRMGLCDVEHLRVS